MYNHHYGCMWPHCHCEEGMCDEAVPAVQQGQYNPETKAVEIEWPVYDEAKGG